MDKPAGAYSGVFELVEEIPEIGGRVGDNIIARPGVEWRPYAIVRPISHAECRWVFTDRCRLLFTTPLAPSPVGLRRLRAAWSDQRGRHLTLV